MPTFFAMMSLMKAKQPPKSAAENLPPVTLSVAEKVLRDIARRNGHGIKKRRSKFWKEHHGPGYMIFDTRTNCIVNGAIRTQDGCDLSLKDVAEFYAEDKDTTHWQRTVIKSVISGRCQE